MVKVLTGVQPGQVSEGEAQVIAGAPVEGLQEQTPQAAPQDFKSWLEATPEVDVDTLAAGVEAGAEQELAIQEQREREAVPDIITRRDTADERVDTWEAKAKADDANGGEHTDGGLSTRARNFADLFSHGNRKIAGLQSKHGGAAKETVTATGALEADGTLNRGFLQMMSVVTENQLSQTIFSKGEQEATLEGDVDLGEVEGQAAVTKAQGNKALGDAIHREYQRYKAAQEGRPTDDYVDLSPEQATLLGDMAKEMYFEANQTDAGKQFMVRGAAPDGQVTFTVTKHGADRMAAGASIRKRMFPKQHVKPAKNPLPGGQLVGEGRRYTRGVSGRAGKPAGDQVIRQAMRNLNQVANVVDPQRLKILYATAIPVLQEQVGPDSPLAIINHVGKDKVDKLMAANPETAAEEYAGLVFDLAQSIHGVAVERKGANYLTYYMQSFNGRIAPQQTAFDPTTSKTVRFVTRNAVPANTANPRIERNLRQMYAMMLVKGADALLPAGRDAALEKATPQLVRWGKELRSALDQVSDAQVEAVSQAIEQGLAVTDPNFPQLPDIFGNISPDLAENIAKKGEDGQAFIDGVLDFTTYYEKKLRGQPHHSYFNAYMDGKTNGLASNGIQMGSEKVAYKTGVLRSQGESLLDNNEDIRDDLKNVLLEMVDNNGFDGHVGPELTGPLHDVAATIYGNRNLNKATTMTFGYGKELDSFKEDIDEWLAIMEQGDPELASKVKSLVETMGDRQKLIDTLHGKYIEGLANALDPNALKSRALMRSAAYLFALSNEIFTIESATGFELAVGGTESTGVESQVEYGIKGEGLGERGKRITAKTYGTEATSSAVRTEIADDGTIKAEVGGYAYGGSVPAPVQSLDAATVALTASGRSWNRLKSASGGAPYLHTIYDAFKVDAMGYDVVLEEVNKNWLDAGMNWSYLEETKNAVDKLRDTFKEKFGNRPNNDPLTDGEARQMLWFLELQPSAEGKQYPGNLYNKMGKLIDVPAGADAETVRELSGDAARRIQEKMKAAGYNIFSPPAQPTVGHLKTFMKAFSDEINLGPRLSRMISETNENKAKLKSKIKKDGAPVYQYYAH